MESLLADGLITPGLEVKKVLIGEYPEIFKNKWVSVLKKASLELQNLLWEEYNDQLKVWDDRGNLLSVSLKQ